ncbi:MAG: ribosomal RNA small subunit methyltransferase A [Methanobacteriota archaeon]
MTSPRRSSRTGSSTSSPSDLGQNFLVSDGAVAQLIEGAGLSPGERVLDVGAGEGAITRAAADAVGRRGRVFAVEFDPKLADAVRTLRLPNVEVIEGDALTLPLPRVDAVVANPPFRVAAPILLRLVDARIPRILLVVPRELSDRLTARVGSERYGRLTVRVRMFADVARLFSVPRSAFHPRPDVPCAVVRLLPKAVPAGPPKDLLERLLAAAWDSKHRTLRHGLAPLAAELRVSSGSITAILRERGWEGMRANEIAPMDYYGLGEALAEVVKGGAAGSAGGRAASSGRGRS